MPLITLLLEPRWSDAVRFGKKPWIPSSCSKGLRQTLGEYQVSSTYHCPVGFIAFTSKAFVDGRLYLTLLQKRYCQKILENIWLTHEIIKISKILFNSCIRFANDPGDRGSIPGQVIPKTLKMVLDTTLLNTQHYKVRIKGAVEQSRVRSSALRLTSV